MKVHKFTKFRKETEQDIRKLVNVGRDPEEIREWLVNRVSTQNGLTYTSGQLAELFDMIPVR